MTPYLITEWRYSNGNFNFRIRNDHDPTAFRYVGALMITLNIILLGLCLSDEPNETELDLLEQGYSQTAIDLAYEIGDATGDYNFIDAAN